MKSSFFKSATSICAVSAGASLMYDTMPLFLGRAADSLQLDEAQMGTMGSIYLLAMTLGAASGVLWVKRTNWRWVIRLAFGLTSGLFFAYGLTEKFFVVLALQALIGSLMGMVLAVGFAAAAQTPEPDRVYGFKNAAEIGLSALVMLLVPWFASDLVALAATFAVLLVLLTLFTGWLPDRTCFWQLKLVCHIYLAR
jgi:MFS family permease